MKCAVWPAARVGTVEPEHVPGGLLRLTQVGPLVSGPAGGVWVSATVTLVRGTGPVLVTA